jgi:phenolic acid decarboxylase
MNKGELRQSQDNRSKAIYKATKSEPVADVAHAFHISRQRVHQIIKKERWKEIRGPIPKSKYSHGKLIRPLDNDKPL